MNIMRRFLYFSFFVVMGVFALAGCGGGNGGALSPANATPSPTSTSNGLATVALKAVTDPWDKAAPRWRDIGNNAYSDSFRRTFSYASARVSLSYERAPGVPFFVGHVSARGLKPNFAYQLKLAGKPVSGNRGWGTARSYVWATSREASATAIARAVGNSPVGGDDWTNQQLGFAGRWWDDTRPPGTNLDDDYFRANYPSHTVYGYLFPGVFVTDKSGNAEADFNGQNSCHITWQDEQNGAKDVEGATYSLAASSPNSAYDAPLETSTQKLWYELEAGRDQPVQLRRGTYHCRLMLTEEAFHSQGGEGGGIWQTVLATEDVRDVDPDNDVVFSIG